jgi:hypothetical protein
MGCIVDKVAFPNFKSSYLQTHDYYVEISGYPCFFITPSINKPIKKVAICFHGNGEDLGYSIGLFEPLARVLEAYLIIVEFPGYGLFKY